MDSKEKKKLSESDICDLFITPEHYNPHNKQAWQIAMHRGISLWGHQPMNLGAVTRIRRAGRGLHRQADRWQFVGRRWRPPLARKYPGLSFGLAPDPGDRLHYRRGTLISSGHRGGE